MVGSAFFRFLDLSEDQVEELKVEIPSVEVDIHYKTGNQVASIELIDSSLVVKIDEFRRKKSITITSCDVFVSISSNKRDEIWRAPKAVNYVINIVNCPIVFSYTC